MFVFLFHFVHFGKQVLICGATNKGPLREEEKDRSHPRQRRCLKFFENFLLFFKLP